MVKQTPAQQVPSLVDVVYQGTRESILSGVYNPGDRLTVQQLADEFGVSFVPVREALRLLESERLVESIPHRGARVTGWSKADIIDTYDMLGLLESEAVRRAMQRLTDSDIRDARTDVQKMVAALEAKNLDTAASVHRRFHERIYQRCESEWLVHVIELIWTHADRYQRLSSTRRSALDHAKEHAHILTVIQSGDPEEAASTIRSHLSATVEVLLASTPLSQFEE